MTSEEINNRIREIDDDETAWKHGDSGKSFPSIGWFWRTVNFDDPTYKFGYIPIGTPEWTCSGGDTETHGPRRTDVFVGFMENNKWDYPYTRKLTTEEWAKCRSLIETACQSTSEATLRAVWDFVQGFAP
jgi:hypothetical protein